MLNALNPDWWSMLTVQIKNKCLRWLLGLGTWMESLFFVEPLLNIQIGWLFPPPHCDFIERRQLKNRRDMSSILPLWCLRIRSNEWIQPRRRDNFNLNVNFASTVDVSRYKLAQRGWWSLWAVENRRQPLVAPHVAIAQYSTCFRTHILK